MLANLDSEVKMATSTTYFSILDDVQKSNLNFKMEISPFSAVITLKKTAIKDSSGFAVLPVPPSSILLQQAQLEISKLSQKV